jgi:hypothetical protein
MSRKSDDRQKGYRKKGCEDKEMPSTKDAREKRMSNEDGKRKICEEKEMPRKDLRKAPQRKRCQKKEMRRERDVK